MKNDPASTRDTRSRPGRSADARGDTGTASDAVQRRERPHAGTGDVGGMPSTTDAGVDDRLGGQRSDRSATSVERGAVREDTARQGGAGEPAAQRRATARDAAADDEGPLESLGKAVAAPVLGSPPQEQGEPRPGEAQVEPRSGESQGKPRSGKAQGEPHPRGERKRGTRT